ncbi:MAG: chloride channel protein [Candidatus Poribacteria bacterium]
MANKLSDKLSSALKALNIQSIGRWIIYSILIGIVSGLGAIIFYLALQAGLHFFLGVIAGYYPPAPGGEPPQFGEEAAKMIRWLFLLIPTVGGLISGFIIYQFAPEAEGHGTDAVIEAFHHKGGMIRARVPIIKTIASAFTLGSGGSGGREGPIAQIGAGFGSFLANVLKLSERERRIMVAAGMGSGIGAIFKSPMAGAIFAAEVLYRDEQFEHEVLVPATIASIVGYSVYASFFGWHPLFKTPNFHFSQPLEFIPYTLLGVLCAIMGLYYIKSFYGLRDLFARIPIKNHFKPAIGGLLTGVTGFFLPQVMGLSYGQVQNALDGVTAWNILLAIAVCKVLTTSFSISSGGSGGVFGPSMVIGGAVGGAVGQIFHGFAPGLISQPGAFVIVGMAGFFAGAANTPISTIIMVSEMTGNYNLLVPSMWVCTISFLLLRRWSIYEKQAPNRAASPAHYGEYMLDVLEELRVGDWMNRNVISIAEDMSVDKITQYVRRTKHLHFPVLSKNGELVGLISLRDLMDIIFNNHETGLTAKDIAVREPATITPEQTLREALHQMNFKHLEFLPVLSSNDSRKLAGVLTRTDLIVAYDSMAQKIKGSEIRPHVDIDDLERIPVQKLMLTKYDFVKEETPLKQILALEETSPTIDLPVVDDEGHFLGLVGFNDLRAVLLHDQVHSLVIAKDVMNTEVEVLNPHDSLADAMVKFVNYDFDLLPVVDANSRPARLVGIARRADIMKRYRLLLNPKLKETQ